MWDEPDVTAQEKNVIGQCLIPCFVALNGQRAIRRYAETFWPELADFIFRKLKYRKRIRVLRAVASCTCTPLGSFYDIHQLQLRFTELADAYLSKTVHCFCLSCQAGKHYGL